MYKELLLIEQDAKAREVELQYEKALLARLQEQHQQGQGSEQSFARSIFLGPMRLLVFAGGMIFVLMLLRRVDVRGGLGEGDLFKDNFQEFHPPESNANQKLGLHSKQKGKGEQGLKEADDESSFTITFGAPIETNSNITFDSVFFSDVMGNEDAKEELNDLADYLKDPQKYQEMGLKIPKGVLLSGPPGTGKTLLARALAGEAGVPFINVNGSSFVQMFAGLGAQRVRRLFQRARELSPCIIFIDEIDALGTRRDTPQNFSRQALNQLLGEMDGFADSSGVIVVGATNLAHTLDPALVRPGRFDRTVEVTIPDRKVRKQIIQHYLKEKALPDVDIDLLAASTTGFTGAEIFNVVNRAGIEAVKQGKKKISMNMLIDAQETLMMGRASKDKVIDNNTKNIVAYHEAGHALVALYTKGANPIYKVYVWYVCMLLLTRVHL